MKMELIQPFINAADAVLSQGLQGSTKVDSLAMEEHAYRRKGVAGMVALSGDIEGRIVLEGKAAELSRDQVTQAYFGLRRSASENAAS